MLADGWISWSSSCEYKKSVAGDHTVSLKEIRDQKVVSRLGQNLAKREEAF